MSDDDLQLQYDIVIRVRPERNPSLNLPEEIVTRRGLCIKTRYATADMAALAMTEIQGGLRAIEFFIKRWQAGEVEVPEKVDERIVLMTEGLFQELGMDRVLWGETVDRAVVRGEEQPIYAPVAFIRELPDEPS